ncbi:unnamed protein product [Anisakis simplex]|uniref:Proton-coupled folate transporter n=1 Tax=Anisakis simplex TaxID=6269 RepID=A0A0M3JRF1_ANISI|nr:unnamed protein product [Anisakis simplex]
MMTEPASNQAIEVASIGPAMKLEAEQSERKPVLHRSHRVAIPLCVYSVTASMFLPVFQSLIYQKCIVESFSSVVMCVIGGVSSALLGRLGDAKSRKMALLVPFAGLILADCTLILQSYFSYLSAYWLILSEGMFALCGGYMSIISCCFAYASDAVSNSPSRSRSKTIAILEGFLGLGGTIGFLCTPLLKVVGFTTVFTAFSFLHCFCILCFFLLPDIKHQTEDGLPRPERTFCGCKTFNSLRRSRQKSHLPVLVFSFAVSFLAFIGECIDVCGSIHILFYYLKYRFNWDATLYGLLKGPLQAVSTVATLFLYPWLRSRRIADCSLVIAGIISRLMGRLWIAVAWNTHSVFLCEILTYIWFRFSFCLMLDDFDFTGIYFTCAYFILDRYHVDIIFINEPSLLLVIPIDSLSRFSATGLRAMMANSVMPEDHGSLFALVAVVEAVCNLLAAVVFHLLFPVSIPVLPQFSFIILASFLIIPLWLIWSVYLNFCSFAKFHLYCKNFEVRITYNQINLKSAPFLSFRSFQPYLV